MTISAQRPRPSDDAELRFLETPAGQPAAVKTWWYPGNTIGREFIYPKSQAVRLAKATNSTVLTTQADKRQQRPDEDRRPRLCVADRAGNGTDRRAVGRSRGQHASRGRDNAAVDGLGAVRDGCPGGDDGPGAVCLGRALRWRESACWASFRSSAARGCASGRNIGTDGDSIMVHGHAVHGPWSGARQDCL